MVKVTPRTLAASVAAGAILALPALAGATPATGLAAVSQHTDRAETALTHAGVHFEAGQDGQALADLRRSRVQVSLAVADAARLVSGADTARERAQAARALRVVAVTRDGRVSELIALLEPAGPRADRALATAALADVRGREHAITQLEKLVQQGLPAAAERGVARAIAALSGDREQSVAAATEAMDEVAPATARTLARVVGAELRGLDRAEAILTALMGELPEAARPGLQRALDAIGRERDAAGEAVAEAGPGMPPWVRELVGNRVPAVAGVPGGPPADMPGGPPAGVPGGPPANVPSGPPASIPGPPAGVPEAGGPPATLPVAPPVPTERMPSLPSVPLPAGVPQIAIPLPEGLPVTPPVPFGRR